mmetsp:Transcript_13517/g.16783  ORF Transcript_13517/g.16783 Transcript_13517/m.16783 type:complete len:237 (+) Transcript_13517:252-962(+)
MLTFSLGCRIGFRSLNRVIPASCSFSLSLSNSISHQVSGTGKLKMEKPKLISASEASTKECNWVRLKKLHYLDELGRTRSWEMAERTTRKGDIDGVAIVATLLGENPKLILVSQYRPPTNALTLEFPAGLVDEGESASEASLRELKEETGYVGEVKSVSPVVFSDPGLTNANMKYVTVECPEEMNRNPVPQQEENEFISIHVVEKHNLLKNILDLAQKHDFEIDARLYGFALSSSL